MTSLRPSIVASLLSVLPLACFNPPELRQDTDATTTDTTGTPSLTGTTAIDPSATSNDPDTGSTGPILDGTSSPDAVRLWANTQQTPGSASDPADSLLWAYTGPIASGYARQVSAGAFFPVATPDPDFFVDFAVEKFLLQAEGIGDATPLRFACGSGVAGSTLSTDFSGAPNLALLKGRRVDVMRAARELLKSDSRIHEDEESILDELARILR